MLSFQSGNTYDQVGIFPVLWVSLIVNAPRWKGSDDYTVNNLHLYTRAASNQCVVLYIVGLQSWVRPQCKDLVALGT
jgi:hypothetical protein